RPAAREAVPEPPASPDPGTAQITAAQSAAATAALPTAEAPRVAPALSPARQLLPVAVALSQGKGRVQDLVITLDPGELGQVEIRLSRDKDGNAALRIVSEKPETMALLSRDQRELQQGLAQSGITLSDQGMSFEMAGGDAQSRQDTRQGAQPGWGRPAREAAPAPQQYASRSLLDFQV
ncbi:flagellar hook-length control protein FliK, partial [Rhodovarius lipocyclicus]|uniref:flagellar hook-length control protein FliK n=1 Tax=Rhodovarius lipocyclicus TaxID=268410 RepID=UPI0019175519